MGLIESALGRLKQPEAVRLQMLANLFLARIHNVVKPSYDQYQQAACANEEFEPTEPPSTGPEQRRATAGGVSVNRKPRLRSDSCSSSSVTRDSPKIAEESTTSRRRHDRDWDWRGFPGLWRPLALYDLASTSWMAWASLRSLLRNQLAGLLSPVSQRLFGLPGDCLLLGRLATPVAVSHLASLVLSSFHLCWRLVQSRAKRNRLISVIVFLMASERDVSRAYKLLARRNNNNNNDNNSQQQLRLFQQVMCYPVYGADERVYFKLRPNRTREAREQLRERTALVTLVTLSFFGFLLLVVWSLVFVAVVSDYRYVHVYPGCYPKLDELLARGQLGFFSATLWNHHLISAIFDGFENHFIWLDCGLSITCVPAFTYLLNYDLLLYWSSLNRKLQLLATRSRWLYLTRQQQQQRPEQQIRGCDCAGAVNGGVRWSLESPQLPISKKSGLLSDRSSSSSSFGLVRSLRTLEADIHELQFEMFDFFHQVQKTDLFVGDVLTAAILIWLAGCGFVTYNHLTFNVTDSLTSIIIELILVLSFFVISLATYHLLELRHRCLASYQTMCSLIVYDQTRKKRHFKKVMDFYLDDSTSYHLCRAYAYKPTTFITIIGWTFSCFFIAITLFKPQIAAD